MQRFELVQFDMLEGEGISYTNHSPYSVDTKMGIRPIELKRAYMSGEDLIIEGKNFTEFSKANYAENLLETEYVNTSKLIVKQFKLKESVTKIFVSQADENSYILSSTKSVNIEKQ